MITRESIIAEGWTWRFLAHLDGQGFFCNAYVSSHEPRFRQHVMGPRGAHSKVMRETYFTVDGIRVATFDEAIAALNRTPEENRALATPVEPARERPPRPDPTPPKQGGLF